ncbi:MAG: protein kinase domain-containing protein [Thermoanaerobaculia bacterium]
MPLSPGTSLGPYVVQDILGKGGMGEVYRARDSRLDRDVAIKVISDSIAHDAATRTRFEREAKAIAALSHPTILSIFDFSKDGDHWYTVTELLEGETLRERLKRGKLAIPAALEIADAVAAGLCAAHDRGIVHRDLKPENVFITKDGAIKILDFGLATMRSKQRTEDEATEILATKAGQMIGTAAYMAPEQIRGEQVTAAADIFAFGCMLYESIAGHRPFRGENLVAVVACILNDAPAALPADVPAELAAVIIRCLEKEPSQRFASAQDLRAALRGAPVSPAAFTSLHTRVIVLPFRMLRRDDDLDFLAYSLPDAIVGSLAGITSLIVRSSLAASQYASGPVDIARIAADQDVNAIVSGTILTSGGRLRVSAQLTEMPGASVKWSHSTETVLDDIFGVQDELTRKIVQSLSGGVSDSQSSALRKDVPRSAEAYECFLRANQQAHTREGWLVARDLYRRSLEVDPDFAPAWARLGRCYWLLAKYTDDSQENWTLAEEALQKAIELNPDLSVGQRFYAEMQIELDQTIESLQRLMELVRERPNDAAMHAALGKALRYGGLLHESIDEFRRARELDPRIPISVEHTWFMLGDYERALQNVGKDIGYAGPLFLMMLGKDNAEPARQLRTVVQSAEDRQFRAYAESLLGILEGDANKSRAALDLIVAHSRDPESLYYQARAYAHIGEHDRALDLLERSSRGFFPITALERDPWLDPLRDSARFAAILRNAREQHERARAVYSQQEIS